MRVGRWFAAAAVWTSVWLVAVAVVAAVAWFAIDSAGREVSGSDDAVSLVSAARPSPAATSTAQDAVPAPAPSSTNLGAVRPGPGTQTETQTETRTGTQTGTRTGTQTGKRTGTPTRPPSVPGSSGGRTSSYSTAGGDLVVRCVRDKVTGWAMRPADGWRAEAAPAAGGELQVLFVAGEDGLLAVDVACRDGQAAFSPTPRPARD